MLQLPEVYETQKGKYVQKEFKQNNGSKSYNEFHLETLWFLLPENFTKYELLPSLEYLHTGLEGYLLSDSFVFYSGLSYKQKIEY